MSSLAREEWFIDLSAAIRQVYPTIRTVTGPSVDPVIVADGRSVLLFCSPNYLGLSNDPEICMSFKCAVDRYGAGTNGSGVVSGYTDQHERVEHRFAEMVGESAALFFNCVSDANTGLIGAVVRPSLLPLCPASLAEAMGEVAVFQDLENHASLLDAARLARPDKTCVYGAGDMEQLEKLLSRCHYRRKLIVTDGYFSMSARLADLPTIMALADRYNAMVMVDDAHGVGVLGKGGRGCLEHFGLAIDSCLKTYSAGKAFGIRGGVVTGDTNLIDYLRVDSRRYVFSGTLPAAIPAAICVAIDKAEREPWRRERVLTNAQRIRDGLKVMGCNVLGDHHIVPWFIGDDRKADLVSAALEECGIFASSIRFPAVKRDSALIRFMPMATHTDAHIDELLDACRQACRYL